MEKHQFKPFEQVLVRDSDNGKWLISHYGYETTGVERQVHVCLNGVSFYQCIPYNEETAHLVGTTDPYKEPEPKVWKVTCHKNNQVFHFTNDELKQFIENAVVNNHDIQWFTTTYDVQ